MLNHRTFTWAILIGQLLVMFFICWTWGNLNKNVSEHGGEMADGLLALMLIFATIYYFTFMVWTYRLLRNPAPKRVEMQLVLNFLFSLGLAGFLLFNMYA